ncbi:MAG TPA: hypothetical protein VEW03_07005, partial [Longimicrobiaceae bacterium]|nr:hypothetical protein [Longimicrobiaceae bacterium]
MPRWARLAAALVLAAAACRPREPVYGPVPIPPARPPRAAPAPAPREPGEPVPAAPAVRRAPPVRVGLVVDAAAGEVTSLSGLTVETEDGRNLEELDAGSSLAFSADRGTVAMEVRDRSGRTLRTRRGLEPPVVVRAADGGAVAVRGVPYRGAILVQAAGR